MLNKEEREERRHQLGASEIYKISNFNSLQCQVLWEEKIGISEQKEIDNKHVRAGNILEQPCLDFYGENNNISLKLNERIESKKVRGFVASLDARDIKNNIPIENKVIGVRTWYQMYAKRKSNAGYSTIKLNIPNMYFLQVQAQIHVCNADYGIILFNVLTDEQKEDPLNVVVNDFIQRPVKIDRNDVIIDEIIKRADYFMFCINHKKRPSEIEYQRKELF
ncbi:YqaJ viral recombinase family protein [Anaerofustis sp.]|uniref:YqaJ viral recombinase family protein n=1 Tax=Anaerofustis sp. TaxID=1872517 RepID=UPI0025BC8042|nr:YqaJ viral recombinase family protein [Anaerofustis sp.]